MKQRKRIWYQEELSFSLVLFFFTHFFLLLLQTKRWNKEKAEKGKGESVVNIILCVCLRVEYLSQIRKGRRPLILKDAQWICFKHLSVSIRFVFVFILPSQKLHFQLDKTMNVRLNGIFWCEKRLFGTQNSMRTDKNKESQIKKQKPSVSSSASLYRERVKISSVSFQHELK